MFGAYFVAGVILGGSVWPLAIRMMSGSSRQENETKGSYQFPTSTHEVLTPQALSTYNSAAIKETITALEAQLRSHSTIQPSVTTAPAKLAKPARILTGTDVKNADETKNSQPGKPKPFGGDFYPTELHPDDRPKGKAN